MAQIYLEDKGNSQLLGKSGIIDLLGMQKVYLIVPNLIAISERLFP